MNLSGPDQWLLPGDPYPRHLSGSIAFLRHRLSCSLACAPEIETPRWLECMRTIADKPLVRYIRTQPGSARMTQVSGRFSGGTEPTRRGFLFAKLQRLGYRKPVREQHADQAAAEFADDQRKNERRQEVGGIGKMATKGERGANRKGDHQHFDLGRHVRHQS